MNHHLIQLNQKSLYLVTTETNSITIILKINGIQIECVDNFNLLKMISQKKIFYCFK